MADQELRLKATAEGFDEAAGKVKAVDDAQKQVASTTTKGIKATEAATAAQDKANVSAETYTALLSRISPGLAALFDGMVKGTKIIGDLATQQLSLRGVMSKTAGVIRANANALKLIGAGGAVVAGIMLIVRAVNQMKEAFEKVTKRIKEQSAALTEATRNQREATQAYLDDAAARKPRGGDTVETLTREAAAAKSIADRFGLTGERRAKALAAGRMVAGLGLEQEQLRDFMLASSQARQALEIGPGVSEPVARARVGRWTARRTDEIARAEKQAREDAAYERERASHELRAGGGGTAYLESFLRRTQGMGAEEAAERAEQLQRIGAATPEELRSRRTGQLVPGFSGMPAGYVSTHERGIFGQGVSVKLAPQEVAQLEFALHALTHELQQMRANGNGIGHSGPVIQNSRVYLPGSGYDRNSVLNGETKVRNWERAKNPW
jgi:hypothetical protein